MTVTFPGDCTTDASRMAWCYRAQEKLRLIHNGMGKWYKTGLSEDAYNQFPNKIKSKYPYIPQLSKGDWINFQGLFEALSSAVVVALLEARQEATESTYWNPSIDTDINNG